MTKPTNHSRPVYTVSKLTRQIKTILEQEFPLIWIAGEISNLRTPASGHHYFTLKDPDAQISAVIFKGPATRLKFKISDGLAVVGLGRLSVYEPRGTYQVLFEHIEPKGIGALQLAFDELKNRLAAEGLFEAHHKKEIPSLPRKVHIITSPTGAVVHDTIQIIHRRFPNMPITVIPVSVQGENAATEIVSAIERLNRQKDAKIAILARGGGSLEDLQPFNSEPVARAIFASRIPVISAVGHETDYTIADFVSDLRAPTPSAAAEIAVPEKDHLQRHCDDLTTRIARQIMGIIYSHRNDINRLADRLRDPKRQIQESRLKLDDTGQRLLRIFLYQIEKKRTALHHLMMRQNRIPIRNTINRHHEKLERLDYILLNKLTYLTNQHRAKIQELILRLDSLNPLNVLKRGYSITRSLPTKRVVKTSASVKIDEKVEVQLSSGVILCRVEGK